MCTGANGTDGDSIHNLGMVGHIEDIAVAKDQQGKRLGLYIIQALDYLAEKVGCYKVCWPVSLFLFFSLSRSKERKRVREFPPSCSVSGDWGLLMLRRLGCGRRFSTARRRMKGFMLSVGISGRDWRWRITMRGGVRAVVRDMRGDEKRGSK